MDLGVVVWVGVRGRSIFHPEKYIGFGGGSAGASSLCLTYLGDFRCALYDFDCVVSAIENGFRCRGVGRRAWALNLPPSRIQRVWWWFCRRFIVVPHLS